MELSPPPRGLEAEYAGLFTTGCLHFLHELISTFDAEVEQILQLRASRKAQLDLSGELPTFLESTAHIRADPDWRVLPVPTRLQKRHVDIGDMAPFDTGRFLRALRSPAQGIQVDFDDGNCPTFHNQIKGLHNVLLAVSNRLPDVPHISQAPVLMLRPRAWNMVEHHMMVTWTLCFYLFKATLVIISALKVLMISHRGSLRLRYVLCVQLGLPLGCIKATVLIENVLATFEMEEILYELREHSAGLNCGIWDYSASFVNKFGHRQDFLLPDRSKYVNMEKRFLRSYMDLLVQTCHRRGALATGGMAALLLPPSHQEDSYRRVLASVERLKLLEIKAGVDGFMVYDMDLIEPMQKLFKLHSKGCNQLDQLRGDVAVTPEDLLSMPAGGVTLHGLRYNIAVGVLFINAWLAGKGHFFYRGQVEDSATAEISRSQVWQWIRHQARLEEDGRVVSRQLVTRLTKELSAELGPLAGSERMEQNLHTAADMFLEVVLKRHFPEFLTSYLNLDHTFLRSHSRREEEEEEGRWRARL
uniref:malate synthase n=1 Tax=Cyprinodon variegatus TaxID=28743 RepID=A0A3Q2C8C9_CYPVA